jgi:ribosome-binding factor A
VNEDRRRTDKVAQLVQAEVSKLLLERVKDPRVEGVTVTEVRVSSDLSFARVYFAVAPDRAEKAAEGLERAAPFLRRELGSRLRLRRVPELRFERDEALEHGTKINAILKQMARGEES